MSMMHILGGRGLRVKCVEIKENIDQFIGQQNDFH